MNTSQKENFSSATRCSRRLLASCRRGIGPAILLTLLATSPTRITPQALRVQPKRVIARPDLVCVLCSLSVSALPTAVTFNLVQGGIATGSAPVVITTTLNGVTVLANISLYGYFSSASSALTDNASPPNKIPTSAVLGQMTTGSPTSFTAFTASPGLGPAGAGLLLYTTSSILSLGCSPTSASCRTDSLNLEINLSGLPQLPAGTYNGTLTLQAQAM